MRTDGRKTYSISLHDEAIVRVSLPTIFFDDCAIREWVGLKVDAHPGGVRVCWEVGPTERGGT
jgi:hypothetical protein